MKKVKKFITGVGKVTNRTIVKTKKFATSPGVKKAVSNFKNYSEGFSRRVAVGVTPRPNPNYQSPRLF